MKYNLQGMYGLEGLVALVTGSSGQLGSEIVNALLGLGASCVAADVTMDGLEDVAGRNNWRDDRVALAVCDIRFREQICAALDKGAENFGGINALVNNAGVSVFEPYLERPEASIEWVMEVNLKGTLLCTQEFIRNRVGRCDGAVVNIASHYGLVSPDPRIYTDCKRKNSEIYGATKAGIIQMTRYFAVHAAEHGVRVNAVSPGGVLNPDNPQGQDFQKNYAFRCPLGRMADTEEIVGAVAFLLSPAAAYITGHNLVVDGGMTSW